MYLCIFISFLISLRQVCEGKKTKEELNEQIIKELYIRHFHYFRCYHFFFRRSSFVVAIKETFRIQWKEIYPLAYTQAVASQLTMIFLKDDKMENFVDSYIQNIYYIITIRCRFYYYYFYYSYREFYFNWIMLPRIARLFYYERLFFFLFLFSSLSFSKVKWVRRTSRDVASFLILKRKFQSLNSRINFAYSEIKHGHHSDIFKAKESEYAVNDQRLTSSRREVKEVYVCVRESEREREKLTGTSLYLPSEKNRASWYAYVNIIAFIVSGEYLRNPGYVE